MVVFLYSIGRIMADGAVKDDKLFGSIGRDSRGRLQIEDGSSSPRRRPGCQAKKDRPSQHRGHAEASVRSLGS